MKNRNKNIDKDLIKKSIEVRNALEDDENEDESFKKKSNQNPSSKTPVLESYSRDLTRLAEEGKLDPIVGRAKEIERVSQILSRRKKNNPILIGEPGCVDGETEITIRKVSDDANHNIIIA